MLVVGAVFAKGAGVDEVAFGTGSPFVLNHSSGRSRKGSFALISSEAALAVAAMTRARLRDGSQIFSLLGIKGEVLSVSAATSGVDGIGFSAL